VLGESVWVPDNGTWLPGILLWEIVDTGRRRALVRYAVQGGVIVRRLHWRDELLPGGVTIELDLRPAV